MDEKAKQFPSPSGTTERDWALVAQFLSTLLEATIRPLYTELAALTATVDLMKRARPKDAQRIDQALEMARHNEDTKRSVDRKITELARVVHALSGPNRDRMIADLLQQLSQTSRVN